MQTFQHANNKKYKHVCSEKTDNKEKGLNILMGSGYNGVEDKEI